MAIGDYTIDGDQATVEIGNGKTITFPIERRDEPPSGCAIDACGDDPTVYVPIPNVYLCNKHFNAGVLP